MQHRISPEVVALYQRALEIEAGGVVSPIGTRAWSECQRARGRHAHGLGPPVDPAWDEYSDVGVALNRAFGRKPWMCGILDRRDPRDPPPNSEWDREGAQQLRRQLDEVCRG